MAAILGSKITPPNLNRGNRGRDEDGCFCTIKAKKILAIVHQCGFYYYDEEDNSKQPICYLRRITKGEGEESKSGPSPCCAGGNRINWSASTQYEIVEELDPRICKSELKKCEGTTQKNGSLGGHSGGDPCCTCYGRGGYTGVINAHATLSMYENEDGTKECRWSGIYTSEGTSCGSTPKSIDVSGPLTPVKEEYIYEEKFNYKKMEDLIQKLFDGCNFDDADFKWNQQRRVMFKETEDGSDVRIECEEPEDMFKEDWNSYVWNAYEKEFRCNTCNGFETNLPTRSLIVEFYTDYRKVEERTMIQKSKAQFIPKTGHYWKIFVPTLFINPDTGKLEKRDDFPIVCELVKAPAGEKIEIDPPEEPGYFIIMNCTEANGLLHVEWDNHKKELLGCMEKKNFPKILENL